VKVRLLDRAVKVSLPEEEHSEQLGMIRYAPLAAIEYEGRWELFQKKNP
jgi:hypothetical protein